MTFADELLNLPPFGVVAETKAAALLSAVQEALMHHVEHCPQFARWCAKRKFDPRRPIAELADVPFLPVSIFKRMLLQSVPAEKVVRTVTSSATSGQTPSRIPLDQITRGRQMKALAAILTHRLGAARRPFLVLDAPPENGLGSSELSARAAGMRGYLLAASETEYALTRSGDSLVLDAEKLFATIDRWATAGKPFCLLGYTYVLYQHVLQPLARMNRRRELPVSTIVLHFGGWKRLRDQAVDRHTLARTVHEVFGLPPASVCDVYGFTEQLGVVYPDDATGVKRVPTYSEVLVRDPRTFALLPDGETGLLEFICPLPHSYPGVAVLLDDLGRVVVREPGPQCGVGLEIVGRVMGSEVRGCGDTLPVAAARNAKGTG